MNGRTHFDLAVHVRLLDTLLFRFNEKEINRLTNMCFFSVQPNVSCTVGLAARNWMIHMNPIAKRNFEGSPTPPLTGGTLAVTNSSTAAVLAELAFGKVTRRSSRRKDSRTSNASFPSNILF